MTVREVVEQLYRFLRKEQRELPLTDPDLDDPLPEALAAINGTLQEMAVLSPQFAAKQERHAVFSAPATVAVSGLSDGGYEVTGTWPEGVVGNIIMLPGDPSPNRVAAVNNDVATLHFPYFGDLATGEASVQYDTFALGMDVITVYDPVTPRSGGAPLRPANSKQNLAMPGWRCDDFGRRRPIGRETSGLAYYINAGVLNGKPVRQMRISSPATERLVLTFDARCSLMNITQNEVFNDTEIPVPVGFVESLFLPLALFRFFGSSVMRNQEVPKYIVEQARTARQTLANMTPQARKPARLYPGL